MERRKSNGVELADIFRKFSDAYQGKYALCSSQQKAYKAITQCRTSALGMHQAVCNSCGHQQISYNSCRNRHCPKCQFIKQQLWVEKLKSRLLPVRYFHVVFTVPDFLHRLFYINQRKCYDILFKASSQALAKTTANPSFLGAQSGAVSVLHTWGQALNYHPHIHALVPAGGLDVDGQQWIYSSKNFFVPLKALSKIYRAVCFELLTKALTNKDLIIPEKDQGLYRDINFFRAQAYEKLWHVHIKKTFKGAGQVVAYLGRYTHRVAISNSRLLSMDDKNVSFRWKDYRDNRWKVMELEGVHFVRRFLQHILPCGYYKIRYYGLFASVHSKNSMEQSFALLGSAPGISQCEGLTVQEALFFITGIDVMKCPHCKKGNMVLQTGSPPKKEVAT
jgi:predicted Zn-ribbon and HTH transcriptional regulator